MLNATEGDIKVSAYENFTDDGTSGTYITIPSGAAANDICMPFDSVYIEAAADGDVVIERCR